jgi:hypothetical protein
MTSHYISIVLFSYLKVTLFFYKHLMYIYIITLKYEENHSNSPCTLSIKCPSKNEMTFKIITRRIINQMIIFKNYLFFFFFNVHA